MSHAEYASRPIPVFTKLAVMLRNLPAVRFVVAKFANLLRSNKTDRETQVSQFLGDAALDDAPRVREEAADFAELETVGQTSAAASEAVEETQVSQFLGDAALDDAPRVGEEAAGCAELETVGQTSAAASEAVGETRVSQFLGDAALDDAPRVGEEAAGCAELEAVGRSIAAASEANDRSDREQLIRRRWAETGIKMWSGRSALNIQGCAGVLPAKPGETLPRYDTLEYRLIAGQIVCEGVVVDPPKPRK